MQWDKHCHKPGPCFNIKSSCGMEFPILTTVLYIYIMGIIILVRQHFILICGPQLDMVNGYIRSCLAHTTGPWSFTWWTWRHFHPPHQFSGNFGYRSEIDWDDAQFHGKDYCVKSHFCSGYERDIGTIDLSYVRRNALSSIFLEVMTLCYLHAMLQVMSNGASSWMSIADPRYIGSLVY